MTARRQKLTILLLTQLLPFLGLCFLTWQVTDGLLGQEGGISSKMVLLLCLFFVLYFVQMWARLYSRDYHYYMRKNTGVVLRCAAFALLPILGLFFLFRIAERPPRIEELLYLGSALMSFFFAHAAQNVWIRYLSHLGYFRKNVLVIGDPRSHRSLDSVLSDIGNTKKYVGEIVPQNGAWVWKPAVKSAPRIVSGFADIRDIILREHVGDVLISDGNPDRAALLREIVAYCQSLSISYYVVSGNGQPSKGSVRNLIFPYVPVLEKFASSRDSLTALSLKRLLDLAIASCAMIFLIPLCILIAAAITLADGGPVFYLSTRIGKNGAPIRFYKFRTMIPNAEKEKSKLLAFNERADGPLFKMKNDPRVTRVGRMLRRHSLDEIPQMLQVLAGSLSLVGPRPHLPEEVEKYQDGDYLRLECMPGIVGLPQVSGSNTMNFRQSIALDLAYRRHWSLAMDVRIIARTIGMLLSQFFQHRTSDHY